jgi:hypothetical protein
MIGAAVLALHAALFALLLGKMRKLAGPEVAQSLELLWIPVAPTRTPTPAEPQTKNPGAPKQSNRSPPARSAAAPEQNPAPPENNAITPPIDWQAELAREAQAAARPEHRFHEFDFPRRAPPAAKAREFAWDPNHTQRVETDAGALIVHLNDNCAFVMTPLPFVFCRPGKRPANSDLFEHMHDDPPAGALGAAGVTDSAE